jgi:hypothetical protein
MNPLGVVNKSLLGDKLCRQNVRVVWIGTVAKPVSSYGLKKGVADTHLMARLNVGAVVLTSILKPPSVSWSRTSSLSTIVLAILNRPRIP